MLNQSQNSSREVDLNVDRVNDKSGLAVFNRSTSFLNWVSLKSHWTKSLKSAIIHHIAGEQNHWADLLSHWGADKFDKQPVVQINTLRHSDHSNEIPPVDSDVRVQPFKNMLWMQTQYFPNSLGARNSDGLLVDSNGRIIIPIQCESLRLRLCIIAHAG